MAEESEEKLHLVSLNLFDTDYRWLKKHYGFGWSIECRQWIRTQIRLKQLKELERERNRDSFE